MLGLHLKVESLYEISSQSRQCRSGDDLAFIPDVILVDCQKLCVEQRFVESTYSDGKCIMVFNLFERIVPEITSEECEASGHIVKKVNCDSVQYTPNTDGERGVCNLKYGRSGAVEACANQRTESYDFSCSDTGVHLNRN